MSMMKALILDPDAATRMMTRRALEDRAWTVDELSSDGSRTEQTVRTTKPQLLITDLDSFVGTRSWALLSEWLSALRRQFDDLKVLFVFDSTPRPASLGSLLSPGETDFLLKPFTHEQLLYRVDTLTRPRVAGPTLGELHDPTSGRLDARRIANALGIPLKALCDVHELKYRTVHKTPDAPALQALLAEYHRLLDLLGRLVSDSADVRIWLNTPLTDFGDRSPIQVILEGHGSAVRALLEDLLAGSPT